MSKFGNGNEDSHPVGTIPLLAGAGPVGHGTIKLGGRAAVTEPEAPAP